MSYSRKCYYVIEYISYYGSICQNNYHLIIIIITIMVIIKLLNIAAMLSFYFQIKNLSISFLLSVIVRILVFCQVLAATVFLDTTTRATTIEYSSGRRTIDRFPSTKMPGSSCVKNIATGNVIVSHFM